MSLLVYPTLPGLTFTVVKSAEFNTLDQGAPNKYEVRIAQSINPVWHFTLVYEFLRDFPWGAFVTVSELRTMLGFFLAQRGMAGSFLFTDPDDNYVGPALASGVPNTPWAQLPLVDDGAGNYYSPVQRTLDGNFSEDITQEWEILRAPLIEAIKKLPREERKAVVLVHVLGYKQESEDPNEVTAATRCKCTGKTIYNRLKRAEKKLSGFFKEYV